MANWICHPEDNRNTRLVPVFRRHFEVHKAVENALLRLTAHGIYEAELNGVRVTENKFMPGLTSYYYRIQVQEYDVTALLKEGGNELLVTVGDGWWRWNNNFGYTLALWGELTLRYADGREETIATDERFEVTTDGIVRSDLQKGELYDARMDPHGWQKTALCTEHTEGERIENQSVPVREKERFSGSPMRDAAGNLVIDFGSDWSRRQQISCAARRVLQTPISSPAGCSRGSCSAASSSRCPRSALLRRFCGSPAH